VTSSDAPAIPNVSTRKLIYNPEKALRIYHSLTRKRMGSGELYELEPFFFFTSKTLDISE